jgi:hypothetical protein
MTVRLSKRELATIPAALRSWQQDLVAHEGEGEGPLSPDHFDENTTPLTAVEIDELCERLNLGPAAH